MAENEALEQRTGTGLKWEQETPSQLQCEGVGVQTFGLYKVGIPYLHVLLCLKNQKAESKDNT